MEIKEINQKINTLLQLIEQNDLFALAELMDLKTPAISSIAFNILKDKHLTEDILNEVMTALVQNVHKFKNYKNINGWINAVTINCSIDLLRKKSVDLPFMEEIFEPDEDSENQMVERLAVAEALEQMDDLERRIFVDRYESGLTLKELSLKYNLSMKAVRIKLSKAKDAFTNFYEE